MKKVLFDLCAISIGLIQQLVSGLVLDISWLKDKSLADLDNLPDPDVLANDILENLESVTESLKTIIAALK